MRYLPYSSTFAGFAGAALLLLFLFGATPVSAQTQKSIFVPNIFTPNHDGLNDVFLPAVDSVADYHFSIFDRYGNKVFETTNSLAGWDGSFKGSPCRDAIYVYAISFTSQLKHLPETHRGTVLLYSGETIARH